MEPCVNGGGGHIVPPFGNHVSLVLLTTYCLVFLKVCPKLDHMTHFRFHGHRFKCFKVAQSYFPTKPQTKYTVQRATVFIFNESANAK